MSIAVAASIVIEAGRKLDLKDEEISAIVNELKRKGAEVERDHKSPYSCEAERKFLSRQGD